MCSLEDSRAYATAAFKLQQQALRAVESARSKQWTGQGCITELDAAVEALEKLLDNVVSII